MLRTLAALGVASALAGCVAAPAYPTYGYYDDGYATPYASGYAYPYAPAYGTIGFWGGCCGGGYYHRGYWGGRGGYGGWHGRDGGWHGGGGGWHGGGHGGGGHGGGGHGFSR